MKEARKIAEWIWKQAQLDHDESWQSMMIEDAVKQIEKLLGEKQ